MLVGLDYISMMGRKGRAEVKVASQTVAKYNVKISMNRRGRRMVDYM
jgi:hypothetical protein